MSPQLLTAIVGSVGFLVGALSSYFHFRRDARWGPGLLLVAVTVALGVNVGFLAVEVHHDGAVDAFRRNFDSTLMLATMIGLVGIVARLSRSLRGLDGFLFVVAALAEMGSLTVLRRSGMEVMDRPWFISHAVAFALSGALFIAGGVAGIAYLLVNRMLHQKRASTLVGHVASLESLEHFGRRMPIIGLPLFTYGILTGVCGVAHRDDIGQTRWYLDPSFLFSLGAWGIYAYLAYCAMYRPEIRGRRAATLATFGLGMIVVVFLFREFLSPVHR